MLVEVKDCIVDDRLDYLAKALFCLKRFATFRNITCDFNEAKKLVVFVAYRIKYRERPETGTVFADTPAFVFEASFLSGRLQRNCRQPSVLILSREKAGKVLAKNFLLLIALQTSSAGIPAYNVPFRVQHIERVIGNCLHQELQSPFIWQRFNGRLGGQNGSLGTFQVNTKRNDLVPSSL
jgi:hypothetical protein